ncbi:MAG: 2'-5' RNA ligase family protein [Patescibacteria group bacterium]
MYYIAGKKQKRITLITLFADDILEKIKKIVADKENLICKIPYGIDDDNRKQMDTLPYHFTISSWDNKFERQVVEILKELNFSNFVLKIDKVKIMSGKENSHILYFFAKNDDKLRKIQKSIFEKIPNEKYNPANFEFHITLAIDKDQNNILKLKEKIEKNFEAFEIRIDKLALFSIYPARKIFEKALKE